MKKISSLIAILLFCTASLFSQAPEKFTYQAVVRNANNSLVTNAQVGVRVSILQGSTSGNAAYVEMHSTSTNANGLVTVIIGNGTVQQGTFADIDWANGPFFLKTETDPDGGTNYNVTSTQQLLSVPYALYAKEAGNVPTVPSNVSAFTNDAGYVTAQEIPTIPTVPTNVSAFTNDAGYITAGQVPAQVNADWNATSGAAQILNKPPLFSGNYNDLTNKPVLFSGNYNDLTNKPTIPTVPTNVSAFNNDAGYITATQVPAQVNADWNATSGAAQILNKPALFSGNYNDLTNKPTLFSGNYNDLTNKPTIPSVPTNVSAFNNDAGYITSAAIPAIPAVPTNVSAFSNDAGYLTNYTETDPTFTAWGKSYNDLTDKPAIPTVPTNVSAFNNDAGYITSYTESDPLFIAWDKDYNDLTNKPNIPTVPTNVSAFTNDAGYVTAAEVQQVAGVPTVVSAFQNDAGYITASQVPAQVNADWNATTGTAQIFNKPTLFSGNYNDLTNKPAIPTVPSNVSAFNNDAGYITGYTETDPQFNAWDKNYNDLTNKPAIPTVPTDVSAFYNDAGYITMDSVPTIPTNVSVFENDAHYITDVQLLQIMSTIVTMQNTIDSMGLVIEALYNQINQPDSSQEMTDTSLQVTFTTTGYTNEPAVHQSDLSGTNFIHNGAGTNGLTGDVNDWWIFVSDRRSPSNYTTYIYANKLVSGFTVRRWSMGEWVDMSSQLSKFSITSDSSSSTITFNYYDEDDERWEVETSLYAIKFNY